MVSDSLIFTAEYGSDRVSDSVDEMENPRAVLPVLVTDNRSAKFADAVVENIEALPWEAPTFLALEGYRVVLGKSLPSLMGQLFSSDSLAANADTMKHLSHSYSTGWPSVDDWHSKTLLIASHRNR